MRVTHVMACAMAALVVVLLGVSADATADALEQYSHAQSLYSKESELYEEMLEEDATAEEEDVAPINTSAADMNADNGGPIPVSLRSVNHEVIKFGLYEFGKQLAACGHEKKLKNLGHKIKAKKITTNVVDGISYKAHLTFEKKDYYMEVIRNSTPHPHELPGEQLVVRDSFTLGAPIKGHLFNKCGLKSWSSTEYLQFKGMTSEEIVNTFTGDIAPKQGEFMEVDTKVSTQAKLSMPSAFDWRDHMTNSEGMKVQSQGQCGSCYAFAAASVLSDRFYLASEGRVNVALSPQSILNCAGGCKGGSASSAFKVLLSKPAEPFWCAPYKAKKRQCGASCGKSTGYKIVSQAGSKSGTMAIRGASKVDAMQYQIWKYGPVYMRMMVYSDFPYYRDGVYKHSRSAKVRGDHAIKVVGWGTQSGQKYWLAQNSWGSDWGEKGFFKIARGINECAVESRGIFWAIPDAAKVCPGSPACNNGGSYTKACKCKCADGYRGATCDTCSLSCSGVGFTGKHEVGKCACACAPGFFDGIVNGKPTKCGLKIAGEAPVVHKPIKKPPCVDHLLQCKAWRQNNFCHKKSKFHEYTQAKCPKSCNLCSNKKSAQIKVSVEGKYAFQYGDMLVAVPAGKKPWLPLHGWAPNSVSQFVCGPEGSYQPNLFCDKAQRVTVNIPKAGPYDMFFYRYLGRNALKQSRGWAATPVKLAFRACAGSTPCVFPAPKLGKSAAMTAQEKAEVAQRVADAYRTSAKSAKEGLHKEQAKYQAAEKAAKKKILAAATKAKEAEKKKMAAELQAKVKARKREAAQLAVETKAKLAKAKAIRKEITAKRAQAAKNNKIADEKRHKVVLNINKHKKILNHLGLISAKLASEKAHMDATHPLASKEGLFKSKKAQAMRAAADAAGYAKAAMKRAAQLAKQAAAAQVVVKKKTVIAKAKRALQRKAMLASRKANKAFELNTKFTKMHASTTILHGVWVKKSEAAARAVTKSKEVAVSRMEKAQCIIKDKRSGCSKWKAHCGNKKWKAWMVTHCTESCGFSCTDLHILAMDIVTAAEIRKKKKDLKARKKACPKYNTLVQKYAAYADKYASFATSFEQACQMRKEKAACKKEKANTRLAKGYEKNHVLIKKRMVNLKCFMFEKQWQKKAKKKAAKKAKKKAAKKAKAKSSAPSPTPAPTPAKKKRL